jgi:hypothetical protein
VRYHANQEQNDEDEKANSGDLSGSKSYNSKTEKTGDQGDYKKDQRIVEHGDSFLFSSSQAPLESNSLTNFLSFRFSMRNL